MTRSKSFIARRGHPKVLALLLALLGLPASVRAQEEAGGVLVRAEALEITLGGRLQTQFNTTSLDSQAPSELFIRRARLELGVQVSDRVSGVLHPDFAGDAVELKDAYLRIDATPSLGFLFGKAYRPFGLLEQTTSKRMPLIERGLRIRGLSATDQYARVSGLGYSGRDIGIQVMGAPSEDALGLAWRAGVFRGPLHGAVGAQDSYQLAARATIEPAEALRIGAGWSSRHFARPAAGGPELRRGNAFELDLEWGAFAPGLHLMAELVRAELDPYSDRALWGAQLWAAWRSEPLGDRGTMLEPVFRVSHGDPDPVGTTPFPGGGTLVTPGFNVYLGPLNRLMLNFDIWLGSGEAPDAHGFKAMFQLGF